MFTHLHLFHIHPLVAHFTHSLHLHVLGIIILSDWCELTQQAGPFQSIETAILPNFALQKTDRAFGLYNLIGYASSAAGAFAAALPSLFGNTVASFHYLYLFYGFVGLVLFLLYRNLRMETKRKPKRGQTMKKLLKE